MKKILDKCGMCTIYLIIFLTLGCATFQSEGLLNVDQQSDFAYKHAAISPETDNNVKGALANILKGKGFIVYQASVFKKVIGIKHGNLVLIFECKDDGRIDRGFGSWSQSVKCHAYDLHSEKIIYEGIGEYMGFTVTDDYRGATFEALKNLPNIGNQGSITTIIDIPRDDTGPSKRRDKEKSIAELVDAEVPQVTYIPKPATEQMPVENIRDIPDFKSSPRQNDLAVVIGIENYRNLPKSDFSKSDAGIMKDYLKAMGFQERNIEFVTNERATKTDIEKSIEAWLPNRVKKDSKVFVYYSGHGSPEPKTGDAYIVPYDGDPNYLEVTGYSLKRLYDNLGKLQVAEVVVVLDACFSGAGGRSVLAKGARPLVMMAEGLVLSQNMAVLSATQGTQISTSSPEKGHGIFTYYVLKAIKDGKKNIAEIYEYIKPLVEDEAKQLNVQQSPSISPDAEKIRGRFELRK